jgi:hypothetical protein
MLSYANKYFCNQKEKALAGSLLNALFSLIICYAANLPNTLIEQLRDIWLMTTGLFNVLILIE